MELDLGGKVVLVTGGSSGIGRRIAAEFAREGADVMICARRPEVLDCAAREIGAETGREIASAVTDVTEPAAIDRLRDTLRDRFGRIDILVNNAGAGTYKPFLEVTDEELVSGMAVNFFAQFRVSQRFAPMMMERRSGAIVNISGLSGLQTLEPPFFSTCTGPAKAAEIRFTKSLAAELGPHGIRVNAVAPNFVDVPERFAQWEAAMAGEAVSSSEELKRKWATRVALPDNRWATMEEVARSVVFLASPVSGYTTGTTLVLDGGFSRD